MVSQQFCLKWNNHQGNLINVFDNLLGKESLVDVTLGCEGASIKAHKIVLSACSPFFEELFQNNPCKHPIVILKDLKYDDMKTIVQFMYKGEVNVTQDRLSTLLKTAENLKIKGLTEFGNDNQSPKESSAPAAIPERPNSPPSSRHGRPKRKKNSHESDPMESCSPEVIAESPLNQNSNRSPQAPSTSTSTSTQPAFTSDEHMEFNVPKTTFDDNYGSNKNSNQQITSDKFRINISSTDYEENSFAKQVKREKKSSDDEDIPSPNWTQSSNNQYQSNTINITNESQQPVDIIKPDSPSILPIQMEQEIVRVKESADFDSFDLGNSADSFSDQSFQGHSFSASMHESSNPSSEMLTDTLGNPSQMTSNVNSSQGLQYGKRSRSFQQRYLWSKESMENAVNAVVYSCDTILGASRKYKVPRETLRRYTIRVKNDRFLLKTDKSKDFSHLTKGITDAVPPPDHATLNIEDGNATFYCMRDDPTSFKQIGEKLLDRAQEGNRK
ncbi:Protein bric-a-brac 2 [Nymphon striatum]|nr:Protein bric-a-brac 2 [Nymphon striatum]KAG1660867.1 Protein bric-a-brac 2 [Nymphon striatum]